MEQAENNAAKIVSSAILGLDYRAVVVAGHRYIINPPTIKKIAGAAYHLSTFSEKETISALISSQTDIHAISKALSWFIVGDESLAEQLSEGTLEEVISALSEAYEMVSVKSFMTLSALARSVASLTAKQRQ